MQPNEYLIASGRTDLHDRQRVSFADRVADDGVVDLLHASIGIVTEAGELIDVLKKHLAYGKPIDSVNMAEELGDIQWYVAIMLRKLGISFEQIFDMNINKLQKRFPEKFTEEMALNRNLDVERTQLEVDFKTTVVHADAPNKL